MNRLTDKRFLGGGFYQPKDRKEMLEIALNVKPTYEEIYKKLGEYENTVEQSEKGCDFCNHSNVNSWVNYYAQYFISEITPSRGVKAVEEYEIDGEEFNFCPKCGRRLRGE